MNISERVSHSFGASPNSGMSHNYLFKRRGLALRSLTTRLEGS
jgi:hypothetical protein